MYSEFGDVYHLHRQHVGSYIIDFIFVEQTQHKHATKTAMKLHADGTNATIQTATLIKFITFGMFVESYTVLCTFRLKPFEFTVLRHVHNRQHMDGDRASIRKLCRGRGIVDL